METRVGTYASASTRSWLQIPVRKEVKGKKRSVQVIHPIFEKCAGIIPDPEWKDIFYQAATGVFPKRFGYRDGLLFYKKANKAFNANLPENEYEALEVAQNFFRQMGAIQSSQEIETQDRARSENVDSPEAVPKSWSDIKKEKEYHLGIYIKNISTAMKLGKEKSEQLRKLINLAISLDLLNDDNVVVDGKIVQIKELWYDPGVGRFYFMPLFKKINIRKSGSKKSKVVPGVFMKEWKKFLSGIGVEKKELQILDSGKGGSGSGDGSDPTSTDCTESVSVRIRIRNSEN